MELGYITYRHIKTNKRLSSFCCCCCCCSCVTNFTSTSNINNSLNFLARLILNMIFQHYMQRAFRIYFWIQSDVFGSAPKMDFKNVIFRFFWKNQILPWLQTAITQSFFWPGNFLRWFSNSTRKDLSEYTFGSILEFLEVVQKWILKTSFLPIFDVFKICVYTSITHLCLHLNYSVNFLANPNMPVLIINYMQRAFIIYFWIQSTIFGSGPKVDFKNVIFADFWRFLHLCLHLNYSVNFLGREWYQSAASMAEPMRLNFFWWTVLTKLTSIEVH